MNILQSPAWETYQQSLGRETFRAQGDGWGYLAILEHGRGNSRLYCPYGPEAVNIKALDQALTSLIKLATNQGVTFVRIEPTLSSFSGTLTRLGWKKVSYQSLNPEHTVLIDLTQPEQDIIAQMDQPNRNILRNYHKKGFHVKKSHNPQDIYSFLRLIHQVSERTGMRPHPDSYFIDQAKHLMPQGVSTLWLAELDSEPIASAITLDSDDTRYYTHAAADLRPDVRKLNAPTALLAEAILDAKKQGLSHFDLYGIAPSGAGPEHRWYGFTRFKRSYGGTEVHHAGTWDFPIKKTAYYLYRAYQQISR